jgi:hypothetical protein
MERGRNKEIVECLRLVSKVYENELTIDLQQQPDLD